MSTAATPAAPSQGVVGFVGRIVTSSLGAKVVMAVTGILFLGWLVLHLLGNLAVFAGPEKLNEYAHFLAGNPPVLWGQRVFLIVVAGLHIASGLRLAALNKAARPVPYANKKWRKATLASRTMAVSGIIVLVFLVFHLAHFTWGWIFPQYAMDVDAMGRHDVYFMMTKGFSMAWVALFYVVAVSLVGLHLSHGFWSAFQSLGINGKKWTPFATKAGTALAIGLALAFASMPLAVLFGVIQ